MFIIFFTIFIFIFTIFESIKISIAILAITVLGLFIYGQIKRTNILKLTMLCLVSFVMTGGSFLFYNKQIIQSETKVFLGTGHVVDMSSQDKYIFSDGQREYVLSSKQKYEPGYELRLAANLKPIKKTNEEDFSLSGLFHYQFNYDKWLKMKGIVGIIYENNSIILSTGSNLGFIKSLRKDLKNTVIKSYGTGDIGGLILGMLIGDKSQFSKTSYQGFIDSGLVHIIAVSGGNVVMIVIFLGFVLFRLPFYIRNFFILLFVILYGMLCGMDSSVFRAVLMGSLSLIALFWGREINIWRSISIVYVIMLLYNPYFLVYDIGFLFSFSAIIGLIYFNKIATFQVDKKNYLLSGLNYARANYLSPSIGATIGILPTMIFFMGKINLASVIGNLLVLPIVPFVMIYGFLSTILYKILPLNLFLQIEKALVGYIYHVSDFISQNGLYMTVEGQIIKYIILVLAIVRFVRKRFFA